MPETDAILPHGWPRPSGYAHAIARSGRMIAIAGQVGWDPVTREFESDAFVDQVRQALRNIVTVVTAAGAQITDVVRLTWYVTDREAYLDNLKSIGNAYRAVFGRHFPAMSVVVVAGLIEPRALVEIEATAVF